MPGSRLDEIVPPGGIRFVPTPEKGEILKLLQVLHDESDQLKAAVAFYAIDHRQALPDLPQLISGDGFLCVDIHLPTDIDALDVLAAQGGNVHLHMREVMPQKGELRKGFTNELLHTKLLLFSSRGSDETLICGSHNWTARALCGLNIEGSLVVRRNPDNARLFEDAREYLDFIREESGRFDRRRLSFYKSLQGLLEGERVWVIDTDGQGRDLTGMRFTMFVREKAQYARLTKVGSRVFLVTQRGPSGHITYYTGEIRDTGFLAGAGLDFLPRYFALHSGRGTPVIEGPGHPDPSRFANYTGWATIVVGAVLSEEYEFFPDDLGQLWQRQEDHPLLRRMEYASCLKLLRSGRREVDRVPTIKVAAEPADTVFGFPRKVFVDRGRHQVIARMRLMRRGSPE